ncbi:MAG TPA: hypothetical protein VLC09_08720 [Polyangiaceae bacterium]|nr:hypothetical protein [Polyangiaceae bacterium]
MLRDARVWGVWGLAIAVSLGVGACGEEASTDTDSGGGSSVGGGGAGGGGAGGEGGANELILAQVSKRIGVEGGELELPGVAKVRIPEGALLTEKIVRVSQVRKEGVAPVSGDAEAAGERIAFEPHGLAFEADVELELPRTKVTTKKTPGSGAMKLSDASDDSWEGVAVALVETERVRVKTRSFSIYVAVELPEEPQAVCPNHVCETELGESYASCPNDCAPNCGDANCDDSAENAYACPSDCIASCIQDEICDILFETQVSCPADCGICGDASCQADFEDATRCAVDCICGDGVCLGADGEDPTTCPQDCGTLQ